MVSMPGVAEALPAGNNATFRTVLRREIADVGVNWTTAVRGAAVVWLRATRLG
jgi:hypothetical protein